MHKVLTVLKGLHENDRVENYLYKQVCSGVMTLEEAQTDIANNRLSL